MRQPLSLACLGLAACLAIGAGSVADAGERLGRGGYHGGHGYGGYGYGAVGPYAYGTGGYGFADAAIGGAYVGAPYTRFPRPSEIVPPAWGYGTYGIPTATGIRQAPTAQPTVYVIDSSAPAVRRRPARARFLSRAPSGSWSDTASRSEIVAGGAQIVSVAVPPR